MVAVQTTENAMEVVMAGDPPGPWMRPLGLPPTHQGARGRSWGSDSGTQTGSPALPVSIRLDETPRDYASPRPPVVPLEKAKPESPKRAPDSKLARETTHAVTVVMGFRALKDMCEDSYVEPEDLKCVENLGDGSYAVVDKCEMHLNGKQTKIVAVKHLKKDVLTKLSSLEAFVKEYNLWKRLRNSGIVEVHGIGSMDTSSEERMMESIFIVQEYMDGGSLKDVVQMQMRDPKGRVYSKADAFRWFVQIAEGLAYLHEAVPAVIHRDLKLDNILLKGNISSDMQAKVVDFGVAALAAVPKGDHGTGALRKSASFASSRKIFAQAQNAKFLKDAGQKSQVLPGQMVSLLYMAPELINGKDYNEKADVFSFAMIMYEVLRATLTSLYFPISEDGELVSKHAENVAKGFRPPFPVNWPQAWKDLISSCWAQHPEDRPAMALVAESLKKILYSGVKEVDSKAHSSCCCSIQ